MLFTAAISQLAIFFKTAHYRQQVINTDSTHPPYYLFKTATLQEHRNIKCRQAHQ